MKKLEFKSLYNVKRMDGKLSPTVYSPYGFNNTSDEFIGTEVIIDGAVYMVIGFETNHARSEEIVIEEGEMINLWVEAVE